MTLRNTFNNIEDITKTRLSLDKPTGVIVLDLLNVLTANAKTALLIGQAAVRAVNAAIDMRIIKNKEHAEADNNSLGYIAHTDPLFQYIDNPRDSLLLRGAQQLWLQAQMAKNSAITQTGVFVVSERAVIFQAVLFLREAADLLEREKHDRAAVNFNGLANVLEMPHLPHLLTADIGILRNDLTNRPLGEIILTVLNVMNRDTKNALLMAQAAVRAVNIADKTTALVDNAPDLIDQYTADNEMNTVAAGFVPHDNALFKFIGDPRDALPLQQAQALWMTAQMELNDKITQVAAGTVPMLSAAAKIKRHAAAILSSAADTLKQEGHVPAAQKISALAKHILTGEKHKLSITPTQALEACVQHADNDAYVARLRQLQQILAPSTGNGPRHAPTI